MPVFNICNWKETCNRELITDTNICTESTEKIKNHNYEILNKKDKSISMEPLCDNVMNQRKMYKSSCNEDEEEMIQNPAQVEFLKRELTEKNLLIRTLIIDSQG